MAESAVGIPERADAFDSDAYRQKFETRFKRSDSAFRQWRYEAQLYFDTYGGDPWPEEVAEAMDDEGRPRATFNYALGTINAVLGGEMADRKEPRFLGVQGEPADEYVGEVLTRAVRHVYAKSKVHWHDSMAQLDQLVTGYGWGEAFLNVNRFPTRQDASYVDCFEMFPDPDYKLDNLADARYLIRARRWPLEDAQEKWPAKTDELEGMLAGAAGSGQERIAPESVMGTGYLRPMASADPHENEERVWIFDYQFRKKEPWVAFVDPRRQVLAWLHPSAVRRQLPKREFNRIRDEIMALRNPDGTPMAAELETYEFSRDVYYRGHLAGSIGHAAVVLEDPRRIDLDMFTYVGATGYRTKKRLTGRTMHFGLAAVLYDPQLWGAKAISSGIEYIARGAKDTWVVAEGTFDNVDDVTDQRSKAGATIQAASGSDLTTGIRQMNSPQWHQGFDAIIQLATSAVPHVTNVTDAVKGTLRQERSEVLVSNLQAHAKEVLNPLLEPMTQARAAMGLLIAKLVQKHMPKDDFNRIVGQRKVEGVTHEPAVDPMTGQPAIGPDGKPVLQPIQVPEIGPDGDPVLDAAGQPVLVPITPWHLIRDTELFEFTIEVDLGTASVTAKQALWRLLTETAALQELIQDPQVRAMLLPFMFRNIPGFPAEQAKEFAHTLDRALQQSQMAGTMELVAQTIQELPPEGLEQIRQLLEQAMSQQQGPPAPESAAAPVQ